MLTYIKVERKWRRRGVQVAVNITGAVLIIETLLITMQVIRGIPSHYNISTPLNAAIFSIMGTASFLLALMNMLAIIFLAFQSTDDRVFAWGIRLGLIASLIGMSAGSVMTAGPTALVEATGELPTVGAHSIGLVFIGGFAYIGLILLLMWQALHGQPVIAPNGTMFFAYGLWMVAVTALMVIAVWRSQRLREVQDSMII